MQSPRIILPVLVGLSFLISGCPVSSAYPLGKKNDAVKFNSSLPGTWKNEDKKAEATEVKIEKGAEENTYKVTVTEKGDAFMADASNFNGWITLLNGEQFLVLQEVHAGAPKETFFVYHIAVDKNEIFTHDVTLKVNGTGAITSVEAYREEVTASMKKEGFLAGKLVWKKK